jgi:hypothetical protein
MSDEGTRAFDPRAWFDEAAPARLAGGFLALLRRLRTRPRAATLTEPT